MRVCILLFVVTCMTTGCGGRPLPKTYPVTGVVTLDDQPLEGADVVLVPADPAVRSAGGTTDSQGHFTLKTYFDPRNQVAGAMTGEYGVTISKLEKREVPAGMKPEEVMAQSMKQGAPKSAIPKKYNAPNTSGFKLSVKSSAPEPLKLDLKK